ncbi:aldo/keto reductase [Pantoea sp.]|uniref:aldo/keto reductase n=1 Tax=Pantoea sp. TaxID=69393 RepID=UPI002897B629|nr:aldo/keto reductase [Pantoea sp.]
MKYRKLGQSGLLVSELALGSVPFAGQAGFEKTGNVDAKAARRFIDIALEQGVNILDTADLYSHGGAEEVIGDALGVNRQRIILTSKARSPMSDDPNDSGATRYHLIKSCEGSLRRLKTDHIDLYQIHNWDGVTSVEETLRALEELVKSGKVRYVGTSNYTAWQMMKTLGAAEFHRLIKPVSQQIYYTPESREAEFELLPMALDQNIGTLIWGPLGEGLLTGTVRRNAKTPETSRQGNGWPEPYVHDMEHAYDVIDVLSDVAEEANATTAQVCLAWLLTRPGVTSLLIGSRTEEQLRDNLAAASLELSEAQRKRIEQATRPAPRYPYWHRFTSGMDRLDPAEKVFLDEYKQTLDQRKDLDIK